MKATNLKINDIVTYHHEVVTILSITKTFVRIQFQNEDTLDVALEELEPCKIFEKHLKINDFYKIKGTKCYAKNIAKYVDDSRRIVLEFNSNCTDVYLENLASFGNLKVFIADINYMNELQHIMSIFGKEIHL